MRRFRRIGFLRSTSAYARIRAKFTPGVSPSQIEDSNASSAYGSNTNENQYQIDGTNITAPTNGQMCPFLLSLTKRMSHRWQAVASLTLASVEGLHAGSSDGQLSAAGTFGDDPNELINAFGVLGLDRDFMWKLQGSYLLPADVVLSTNWIWQAGRPYARKLNMTRFANGLQPGQGSVTIFLARAGPGATGPATASAALSARYCLGPADAYLA